MIGGAEVVSPDVRDVVVRDLCGPHEMSACEDLYIEVMGLRPEDGNINPRLLTALQHNGGYALGAFVGAEPVGFAYSFLASDRSHGSPAELYQYSQLVVVSPAWQGRGVGRQLKLAQRERCLADGIGVMRWAYDPMKTRNGHFNLDVLGAQVAQFVPSMYGINGFGTDHARDTDRFIVEWRLAGGSPGEISTTGLDRDWSVGVSAVVGGDVLISVPAQRMGASSPAVPDELEVRQRCRDAFTTALASGLRGVSCRRVAPDVAVYRFTRVSGEGG